MSPLMVTMRQRLSLGCRINFRLCSTSYEALHGVRAPGPLCPLPLCALVRPALELALPHKALLSLPHCLQPALPSASPLPCLIPILLQKGITMEITSPLPLSPTLPRLDYMLFLCAPINPHASPALGVYHSLSVYLCTSAQAVRIGQTSSLCISLSSMSGTGLTFSILAINVDQRSLKPCSVPQICASLSPC